MIGRRKIRMLFLGSVFSHKTLGGNGLIFVYLVIDGFDYSNSLGMSVIVRHELHVLRIKITYNYM